MLDEKRDNEARLFINNVLRCHLAGTHDAQNDAISGLGTSLQFYHQPNDQHHAATRPDILAPLAPAFATMLYGTGNAACVASKGSDYRTITIVFTFGGFEGEKKQGVGMRALASFLLNN